jgi:hypothetical protein
MSLRFEWHDKKAIVNKRKHGITFEEASTVFGDSFSITIFMILPIQLLKKGLLQ